MANEDSRDASPFDLRTIRHLVALMSRHDLSEIDLREGELRIRIRRGLPAPIITGTAPASTASPLPAQAAAQAAPPAAAAEAPKPAKALIEIKSETPGTFYSSPKPGDPPFVQVGSRVSPSTVVCIIEAMKIFNEVTADCSGVIAEVLVEDKQPVEYGQVLFRVDPTG